MAVHVPQNVAKRSLERVADVAVTMETEEDADEGSLLNRRRIRKYTDAEYNRYFEFSDIYANPSTITALTASLTPSTISLTFIL